MSLCDICYDEENVLDFIIKERLSRLALSRVYGVKADLGEVGSVMPPLFDIPFYQMSFRLNDFNVAVQHLSAYTLDLLDELFEKVPFFAVSYFFMYLGEDDKLPAGMTVQDLVDAAEEYSYRFSMEGFDDDEYEYLTDFIAGYSMYLDGHTGDALESGSFKHFCQYMSEEFSPDEEMSLRFIADNLPLIMNAVSSVIWEYTSGRERYVAYSSREVYLYEQYRDELPSDIRKRADECIGIFKHPAQSDDVKVVCAEYDGRCVVLLLEDPEPLACDSQFPSKKELLEQADSSIRYINPFFEPAVCWLDKNLKTLRTRYLGKGE